MQAGQMEMVSVEQLVHPHHTYRRLKSLLEFPKIVKAARLPKFAVNTIVFGLAEALAIYMQSIGGGAFFPNELFIALPYILTIVLTVFHRNFSVPAKLGVAYSKEN